MGRFKTQNVINQVFINLLVTTKNEYKRFFPPSTSTTLCMPNFVEKMEKMSIVDLTMNARLQTFSSFYCLRMWQHESHFSQYFPSRCDRNIVLILIASSTLLALYQPVHWYHPTSSVSLAAEPGILSVCPGDERNFSSHFHVVDSPAVLKVLPLTLPTGLLKVALALHCFNNPILSQEPGVCRENVWITWTWVAFKPLYSAGKCK